MEDVGEQKDREDEKLEELKVIEVEGRKMNVKNKELGMKKAKIE